jgi:glycerol uptake facilitator-like aquaporin
MTAQEAAMPGALGRRALAEFIGTAFLVMAVIGSGIAASRLSAGNVGLELFENAASTGPCSWRSSLPLALCPAPT